MREYPLWGQIARGDIKPWFGDQKCWHLQVLWDDTWRFYFVISGNIVACSLLIRDGLENSDDQLPVGIRKNHGPLLTNWWHCQLTSDPVNPNLVVSNIWIIFHFIYGMSSFPLTNSYFSRLIFNHQPGYYSHLLTIINHHHNHILYNHISTVYYPKYIYIDTYYINHH